MSRTPFADNIGTVPSFISGDRRSTHATIAERASRVASELRAAGFGEDDSVALMLRNDLPFFEATLAAGRLGGFATPINWHFTASEAAYILQDSGARALVAHVDLYRRIEASVSAGVAVFLVPTPPEIRAAYAISEPDAAAPETREGVRMWDDAIAESEPIPDPPRPPRLSMIYTSGTTGKPKGVHRAAPSEDELARMETIRSRWWGFAPGERATALMNGPMYHSATNNYGMSALRSEANIVLQARFDAEEMLYLIERYRITHMHIVPTMFVRLLRLPAQTRARYDVSSLRFVAHGAAACPPDVKAAMLAWWGPVIHEYYGSTEFGLATMMAPEDAVRKSGSVGRVLAGVRVAIVDDERRPVAPGELGEIFVGSNVVPKFTYRGRPESREEIELDGMVTCGDVGRFDDDGFLFLADRKRDMIVSGGVNIYPAEIEAALIAYPGVKDCAVFGLPDDEFGESVYACVQPMDETQPLEIVRLREFLEERLARFKIPKRFEFVSELPREDSGKIFKRKLQDARRNIR